MSSIGVQYSRSEKDMGVVKKIHWSGASATATLGEESSARMIFWIFLTVAEREACEFTWLPIPKVWRLTHA
jgi:hypothetical protein